MRSEELAGLPASSFAVPERRLLPMHDAAQAREAWGAVGVAEGLTDEERKGAERRILARLVELGVDAARSPVQGGAVVLSGSVEVAAERETDTGARVVEVTIIRAGESNNRQRYRGEVLQEAAGLFEGAAAFCDHPGPMDYGRAGGRSLRDLVGVYEGTRWDAEAGAIRGRLRLYPGSEWLGMMMGQAVRDREAGKVSPAVGISADMLVLKAPVIEADGIGGYGRLLGWDVKKVVKVNSADVVFQPAAGGRFERILEGAQSGEGERLMCTVCNEDPCRCEGGLAGATTGTIKEGASVASGAVVVATAAPSVLAGGVGSVLTGTEASRELEAVRAIRVELCRGLLETRLAAAGLPATAAEWLRGRYRNRAFEASELDAEIGSVRGMLGGIVAPGVIQGMGPGGGSRAAATSQSAVERVQLAMDRLFGVRVPDAASDVPRLSGIREAYLLITGDTGFTGRYNWEQSVVREGDEVTTTIMANIVANSMTKRLIADYQAQPKWWLPIVTRAALRDMKVQDRIKLNDFAVLATVAENGAYVNLAWDDAKETYTPAKKGSLVTVTLETIINDDVRGVTRIPSKLAASAVVTINEFVSALFTTGAGLGPQMTDTYTVFDADNHQSNTGAAVLSSANLRAAMIVLAKMTNSASKRIGVIGKYLLVPPDLLYTAQVIAGTSNEPGTANNDINPLAGKVVPIGVPQFTDTNNWYLMADPAQVESIELGFLNGREEPELLVQDNPTAGAVFTNDAMAFKVRWIFGGGWLDYRGAYAAINA